MEFKKFSAGAISYGISHPKKMTLEEGISNVNFECPDFEEDWTKSYKSEGQPQHKELT